MKTEAPRGVDRGFDKDAPRIGHAQWLGKRFQLFIALSWRRRRWPGGCWPMICPFRAWRIGWGFDTARHQRQNACGADDDDKAHARPAASRTEKSSNR